MEIAEDRRLKIGELARQTGLSIKTIRYYESRGLLEQPPRTQGGHRLYGPEEVARVRFIQRAKLLGLTLEEIRELVGLAVRCNEGEILPRLDEVLEAKLKETERKMVELSAFRQNTSTTGSGPPRCRAAYCSPIVTVRTGASVGAWKP
jgi:MerR family transcriptional regulator, mercuric resistance operon regulatory protein